MGTEDWVLKSTKMILNTKKQRLKIQSRGWILKNTILKKKRKEKSQKLYIIYILYIYIYNLLLKIGSLFWGGAKQWQVIKMKIRGVIEDLKIKNKK